MRSPAGPLIAMEVATQMTIVPDPANERVYPMLAPADDHRFTLGLVFDVARVLTEHGFPEITAGGDLVALQQTLYRFLYRPATDPASTVVDSPAGRLIEETARRWGYPPRTETADGHVVYECCGKIDEPHRNLCEHYRPRGGAR